MKTTCPACQSANVMRASGQSRFDTTDAFRVFPLKRCAACGHEWEPPAPAWLLVGGVLAGLAMLGLGILLVTGERKSWGYAVIAWGIGGPAFWGCVRRLRARRRPVP